LECEIDPSRPEFQADLPAAAMSRRNQRFRREAAPAGLLPPGMPFAAGARTAVSLQE